MTAGQHTRENNDLARRVALQHELAPHIDYARVFVGDTLNGPVRLAELLGAVQEVASDVADLPGTAPREKLLRLGGHVAAWLEAADRESAR